MSIKIGDRMPDGVFKTVTEIGAVDFTTKELFDGKKVVLFSLPGAFTPTCSAHHLPGFVKFADEIREKGVDTIACMAVNDISVMHAWGEDQGVGDKVLMLADGNADYVRSLGLDIDLSIAGMGVRGQRFALIVEDGTVTYLGVEKPLQFEVSKAESILDIL